MSDTTSKMKARYRRLAWINQNQKCFYCREPLTLEQATADHIHPKCNGGTNARKNIVAACKGCNVSKGNSKVSRFENRIKAPKRENSLGIWKAWARRRLWLRTEQANYRIMNLVGLK